jgi:hypothetical protein
LGSLLANHLPADVDISLVRLHPLRQSFIHILIHDRSLGFGVPIYSFLPCQQLRRTLQSVANCRLRHRHLVNLLQPLHQGPLTEGWVVLLISIEGNAQGLHQMAASWFGGLCHCWLLAKKKNESCPAFTPHKQCNKVDLQVFLFARQLSYILYLEIQFEAKTDCSSIFQNVPWCSVPTDSCGSDRINQVLYRQEGSKTFRDFPRGLRDLLQNVAQICTVYI